MLELPKNKRDERLFDYGLDRNCTFREVAIEVGSGWHAILEDCFVKLLALGWDGKVEQVKEKWGTLRIYIVNNIPDETLAHIAFDVVDTAEERSSTTCERCGNTGAQCEVNGWLRTLCTPCFHAACDA